MLYIVRAKPKTNDLARLWTLLNDGTIANQEPDGLEIIASMKRATLNAGTVEWTETCYCTPPLKHERATIYDQFFTDIETQPQTGPTNSKGEQFWVYLKQTYDDASDTVVGSALTEGLRHIPLRIV